MLDSVCDSFDFFHVLSIGMKHELQKHKNDQSNERLACLDKIVDKDRVIAGLFHAGHYGEGHNIVDSTNALVSYRKKTTDADMLPCFFRLDIPKERNEALLVLQSDVRVSAKAAFVSFIEPFAKHPECPLTLTVRPVMNKGVFMKLVREGKVQKLRFIKMGITSDFADSYDSGHGEVHGTMELIVKARRGGSLPFAGKINEWLSSRKQVRELYEVEGLDFDTVKADVRVGKTTRTLDFSKKMTTPIFDLTSDVIFGNNGHPTFESLVEATRSLAEDHLSEMYS
jgi:hypothetical protein